VLLKLSGEVFGGEKGIGVDPDVVARCCQDKSPMLFAAGVQVAIVVGGGNYFRGAELSERGMDRSRADYMGMLGTVMNCLALQDFLEKEGVGYPRPNRNHNGTGGRAIHSTSRYSSP
jgi:uridylate kinase